MSIVASDSAAGQPAHPRRTHATAYGVLLAISCAHLLNDSMQAVVPAVFPILEQALRLSYTQLGWLSFALNMTSSVLQPLVGQLSDRRPFPRLLPAAMLFTACGLVGLSLASHFAVLIVSVLVIGFGSAIFHPEGSRVVYYAAGPRRSLAQSIYQVGGNAGQSVAPLMTIFIFARLGQAGGLWTALLAAAAFAVLASIVPWYEQQLARRRGGLGADGAPGLAGESGGVGRSGAASAPPRAPRARRTVIRGMLLLVTLAMARSWYWAGMANYFQFFAIEKYAMTIDTAPVPLFIFMAAGVLGTLVGGLLGDRIGTRPMMIISMLGSAPLALLLPYLPLPLVYVAVALIGFILQSGFSVSVVYAQELMPNNVGMASGLIVGFAFGMGALGAVALGKAADIWGVVPVISNLSYVLLLGLLAFGLPRAEPPRPGAPVRA